MGPVSVTPSKPHWSPAFSFFTTTSWCLGISMYREAAGCESRPAAGFVHRFPHVLLTSVTFPDEHPDKIPLTHKRFQSPSVLVNGHTEIQFLTER